jgi:hypothetical protein
LLVILEEENIIGVLALGFSIVDALRSKALQVMLIKQIIKEYHVMRCHRYDTCALIEGFKDLAPHLLDDFFEFQILEVSFIENFF